MEKFIIITDSCSDLPIELVNELSLHVLPLSVDVDGKSYYNYPDEREITNKDFYDLLRNKRIAKTSQLNSNDFIEYFEKYLQENYDILYIGFSSALSGTYNSSRLAAIELNEKYPNRNIVTIDSLSASMGQGLLLYFACNMKKEGKSLEEIANWVEENKLKLCHLFTVGELGTLKRGGRLSASVALIGTLLNVKPILHVSDEGKLIPLTKARGRKSSLEKLIDLMEDKIENPTNQTIFISHGDCFEEAEFVGNKIKERYGVKDIIFGYIGPVIGAHAGPGTIAIFFIGNSR